MKKKKGSVLALFLALIFLLTGCSQEFTDRVTEAVLENARENASEDAAQQSIQAEGNPTVSDGRAIIWTDEPSSGSYAYEVLDDETKQVYSEIFKAVSNFSDACDVSTVDADVLQQAYCAMMADHGEIFWLEGYSYTEYSKSNAVVRLEFHPQYTMSEDMKNSYQKQVDLKVDEILSGISVGASDYEKAKYVYETLAGNVVYQANCPNNQNILSVFLDGTTVCQGYACATQYLLSRLGVTCSVVSGTAAGVPHAWNLVYLDGAYYYMDTTWGNGSYSTNESGNDGYVNFSYLAVTSRELFQTHTPGNDYPLPLCESTADNYFVREQLYFTEWDVSAMGEGIKRQTGGTVSLKFATDDLYDKAYSYYVNQGHLWDYFGSNESVYYVENPQMRVLIFFSSK